MTHLSNTQKGILFSFLGYSGFAVSDAFAKLLTEGYEVFLIVAYIQTCAAILIIIFSPLLGGITKPGPGMLKFHILRTISNFFGTFFFVSAIAVLPLTTAYAIVFSKPFMVALLAMIIYGEYIGPYRWSAIFFGFCGIVIALQPSPGGIDPAMLYPLGCAAAAAVMWGISRSMQDESPFSMAIYPMIGTTFICLLLSDPFVFPNIADVPYFMICGLGAFAGFLFLTWAYQKAPSSAVSPFHYTQMLWGVFFGFIMFSDLPDLWTIIGGTIVISSGLVLIFKEAKTKQD